MTGLIDCPECGGFGCYPRITKYSPDGDHSAENEVCPQCHGTGEIEVEVEEEDE